MPEKINLREERFILDKVDPAEAYSPVTSPPTRSLFLNTPFSYEFIINLVHLWSQQAHDPIIYQ
jgi:hypothetical protein